MTRIVTTSYRYKRPPRKRKAVPLTGPAVIPTKSSRRPIWEETAAELETRSASPKKANEAALSVARPAANDDRKLATVTAKPKRRIGDSPHLPMELPLSRKPVERDGDDYKRLKAAMTRRLRGETN
jgi:hypothetical protein